MMSWRAHVALSAAGPMAFATAPKSRPRHPAGQSIDAEPPYVIAAFAVIWGVGMIVRSRRAVPRLNQLPMRVGDAVAMSSPAVAPLERIVRGVGVYDADSTIRGELAWVGARLGRRHCSLCEITHGSVRQLPEWRTCRAGIPRGEN